MAPSRGFCLLGASKYISRCASSSATALVARRSIVTGSMLPICSANGAQSFSPHTLRSFQPCNSTRTKIVTSRRGFSSFTERLADPANKLQSYISRSSDPYLNLSIEDHILRKSPADSTILFLYVNRPCVVIGRNQNPWTEVNLNILDTTSRSEVKGMELPGLGRVDIVRRRSGGGTVFHDEGNLNWSITCPRNDFTRDKYAEMVVRALRKQGVERARVNDRHDIVLDQGHEKREHDPEDTHRTPYTVDGDLPKPLKVSGSAYKLTRLRALHHATTLLESPNLRNISKFLRSPAKNNIEAKGVESVSSPVTNIGLDVKAFQQRLQEEFAATFAGTGGPSIVEAVGDEYLSIPDIKKGYDELRTQDWMWAQTPQFNVRIDDANNGDIELNVHHGIIKSFEVDVGYESEMHEGFRHALVGQKLQDINDWTAFLKSRVQNWDARCSSIAGRFDELMPVPAFPAR